MSDVLRHPRALAIAKRGGSCLWDMGDYLIECIGKPRGDQLNDGTRAKLAEVSDELIEHGYPDYKTQFLVQLRATASAFAGNDRVTGISWTAHHVAASPKVLQAVIEAAKAQDRKNVSKRFVQQIMEGVDIDRKMKRRVASSRMERMAAQADAAFAKAQREGNLTAASDAKKKAKDARAVAKKLRGIKIDKSKRRAPKPEDAPLYVAKMKFMADASEAAALVRRMEKEITPFLPDLSKAYVAGCIDQLMEVADSFRKLAVKVGESRRGAHLHAVA